MSRPFIYGVIAGAVLGWWLNNRALPSLPGPYEPPHAKYTGLRRSGLDRNQGYR